MWVRSRHSHPHCLALAQLASPRCASPLFSPERRLRRCCGDLLDGASDGHAPIFCSCVRVQCSCVRLTPQPAPELAELALWPLRLACSCGAGVSAPFQRQCLPTRRLRHPFAAAPCLAFPSSFPHVCLLANCLHDLNVPVAPPSTAAPTATATGVRATPLRAAVSTHCPRGCHCWTRRR